MEKPSTRQVTATGIPSAARSRTSGYFILGELPGEVGGRPAQDLVLLLEDPVALLQLSQLRGLGRRDAGPDAVFDVGELQPAVQRGSEIPKSFAIWDSGASPLRATATTSPRNSAGKGFGMVTILSRGAEALTR